MNKKILIKTAGEKIIPVIWTGKEKNIDYNILLSKTGASVKFLMLLLGSKDSTVKININIIHQKPHTVSKVIVKGVLKDDCNIDFNGLVKIDKGAKLSNAWLSANLMLLSKQAKGRAVPALEILENDVKAGHATTVGKVNENEIFYLMSRGLSKEKAKKIIINGFLSGFLKEFPKSQKYAI
jgi:Fe-S cluster assembly protein SufD